jgi:hypothetical protein
MRPGKLRCACNDVVSAGTRSVRVHARACAAQTPDAATEQLPHDGQGMLLRCATECAPSCRKCCSICFHHISPHSLITQGILGRFDVLSVRTAAGERSARTCVGTTCDTLRLPYSSQFSAHAVLLCDGVRERMRGSASRRFPAAPYAPFSSLRITSRPSSSTRPKMTCWQDAREQQGKRSEVRRGPMACSCG